MHPLLNIAISAIRQGGQLSTRYLDRLQAVKPMQKPELILKIIADIGQVMSTIIQEKYPQHEILIRPDALPTSSRQTITWIINPLSGSHNFIRDLSPYALSIAVLEQGEPLLSTIYNPLRHELFTTLKGNGAQLNDRKIRVSPETTWHNSLIATQTPRNQSQHLGSFLEIYTHLTATPIRIRQSACPILDLAHLASDRLDAAWYMNLPFYDIAPAALILQETGGMISSLEGHLLNLTKAQSIMAGSAKIHKQLSAVIQEALACSQEK